MSSSDYGLRENRAKRKGSVKPRLWAFAAIMLGIFLLFSMKTTQDIASEFSYDQALGSPLVGHYYAPHKWLVWRSRHHDQYPAIFDRAIKRNTTIIGLIFAVLAIFVMFLQRKSGDKHFDLHGSARTASMEDIEKMGVLDNDGVMIGAYTHKGKQIFLRHDGPEHVLAFAPTRSGKGVGLVLPTLLSWPHSGIVYDIKKENWSATASWRRDHANNTVMRFEPACNDGTAARFNPLQELRIHTDYDVADAQNIANMIVDDGDERGTDPHWANTATDLLVGVILHLCYKHDKTNSPASLNDVAAALSDPDRPIDELFLDMLNDEHTKNGTHPVVAQSARSIADKAEKERSGVVSTAMSKLILYRDPIVSKNIATSDFKINDIVNSDNPVTLYICVSPADQDRMKPLTRLLLTMIVQKLAPEIEFEAGRAKAVHKHRLLMMIDEFPSLGRLPIMERSLAFLAGYGIKCYLIIQDFAQLRKYYGRDESIVSNCHVRVAYAPNKQDTAEELSKMTGVTTVTKKDVSTSQTGRGIFASNRYSTSVKEQQRNLFTADEVQRLKALTENPDGTVSPGEMLIFISGQPVIYGDQILYFNDPALDARSKLGAPKASDRLISGATVVGDDFDERFEKSLDEKLAKAEEAANVKKS